MASPTPNLNLNTVNTITDASTVLIYTYVDLVSGSATGQNLKIIDDFAGRTSASWSNVSASLNSINTSINNISASLNDISASISASPVYAPYVSLRAIDSIPPFSGLSSAPFSAGETYSSSSITNKPVMPMLTFGDALNQGRQWNFRAPVITASNCSIKMSGRMSVANATKTINMAAQFACVSSGDTSGSTKDFSTVQSVTVTVPSAANTQFEVTLPITNSDSIASGDDVYIVIYRDVAAGTASGSFIYTGGVLQFVR